MKAIQSEMGDLGPGFGGLGGLRGPPGDMKDPLAGLFGDQGTGDMPAGMKEIFESLANMGGS